MYLGIADNSTSDVITGTTHYIHRQGQEPAVCWPLTLLLTFDITVVDAISCHGY